MFTAGGWAFFVMVKQLSKLPWFPMYAGDWFLSTAEMSNAEKGAYIDLLCMQWDNGAIMKVPARYLKEWETLKDKFIKNGDGKLINIRLNEIRLARDSALEKQRLGGIESGKVRGKQPGKVPTKQPTATRARDQSQKSEIEKESEPKKRAVHAQWFEKFWTKEIWGDLRGRTKAMDVFLKIKHLDEQLLDKICKGAVAYQDVRLELLRNNGTPKMAQGWLNDRRWEDDPPPRRGLNLYVEE